MSRVVVTGAAGFIGSTLCGRLLERGDEVVGVDALRDYYDVRRKKRNLAQLEPHHGFDMVVADLTATDLPALLDGASVVYHLAAQPGVRLSWKDGFAQYVNDNVLATQLMLETAADVGVERFVYASSSSVYGEQSSYPCAEDALPRPYSPYGVTKLAAEQLCGAYAANQGVSTVSLRYFTVYGPGQRPDMAIQRLIETAVDGGEFELYGDGTQLRDFTFVGDVVAATAAAGEADVAPGVVLNVAGGSSASMNEVIALVEQALGAPMAVRRGEKQPGDVTRTGGAIDLANQLLGWTPTVSLADGIRQQADRYKQSA